MVKASQTGGVKPMSIAGRYISERERLFGMTDAERKFRLQWLKDQELSPAEPRKVPELYKFYYNPIRRFYRYPLDQFQKYLETFMTVDNASVARYLTGKALLGVGLVFWMTYYFKYNANDWSRAFGWRIKASRKAVVPGDEGYPKLSEREKPSDYFDRGFKDVKLNL